MDDSNSTILERLLQAAGLRRDSQLAEMLGVSPQAVSQARRKGRIPDGWILKLAGRLQLSTDWLCYGMGTPQKKEQIEPSEQPDQAWLLPLSRPLSLPDSSPDSFTDTLPDILAKMCPNTLPDTLPTILPDIHEYALDKPESLDEQGSLPLPGSVAATHINYGRGTKQRSTKPLRGNAIMPSQENSKSTLSRYTEVALPTSVQLRNDAENVDQLNLLDVTLIPLVGARLAAGSGSLETDADVHGYFAFRQDWLRRKGNPDRMVLMKVFGDSMEPDIHHGDMVLVNQGHTQIFGHAIYAVGVNEEIYIKQVETSPGGTLRLRSLNPRYEPIEVNLHGDLENSVRIIGRVIWWCREA